MKSRTLYNFVREAVVQVPAVRPLLSAKARFIFASIRQYKSQEYFLQQIQRLVRSVYDNVIGGQFIDLMANLISGQLYDAYSRAWTDYGEFGAIPDYLEAGYQEDVLSQYDFVDRYYRNIVDARIDGTPIDPLLTRANMWANQWNNSYNKANSLIQQENGGNLEWVYGETEHCDTCRNLNGIVASAKEWAQLGLRPQNPPNPIIKCGGFNCECQLLPTEKRRSPGAYGRIEEVILLYGK